MTDRRLSVERGLPLARRGTRLPGRRDRRPGAGDAAGHAVPQRLGPQRARRPVVSPLVRRRRHDLGRSASTTTASISATATSPPRTTATRPARRAHRPSRLRQDAAGRRAGQRLPPARQRLQHLGGDGRRPAAVAVGGRRAVTSLDPATLETLGLEDFGGTVKAFSAHPKRDPETGELFNFGIDYGAKCTLTPYRLHNGDAHRAAGRSPCPMPVMNHDFVLTKNYLVFCIGPILQCSRSPSCSGFKSFDGGAALGRREADPDPAGAARRQRPSRASSRPTPSSSSISPTASRRTARWCSTYALSRLPDHRRGGAQLLEIGLAGGRHGDASRGCAVDLVERQGRQPHLRHRHRQRVPRSSTRPMSASATATPISPAIRADRPTGLQQQLARVDFETGTVTAPRFRARRLSRRALLHRPPGGAEDDGVVVTLVFDAGRKRTDIVGLDARDLAAKPLFVGRLTAPRAVHAARHLHTAAFLTAGWRACTAVIGAMYRPPKVRQENADSFS